MPEKNEARRKALEFLRNRKLVFGPEGSEFAREIAEQLAAEEEKQRYKNATPGEEMPDGTYYLGRFKGKDGTEKDWFAAAGDEKDEKGKRLSLTFKQAAERARNSKAHGHDDWMVPTGWNDREGEPDILNAIFNNKAKIAGLDVTGSDPSGWYRSSSPRSGGDYARVQRLSDGIQDFDIKSFGLSVRLVRSSTI
jgi:hypothetical protein